MGISLDAAPLRPEDGLPARVRAQLTVIMQPGPYEADECALLDLVDTVADHLHTGRITVADHDALIAEIKDARMSLR